MLAMSVIRFTLIVYVTMSGYTKVFDLCLLILEKSILVQRSKYTTIQLVEGICDCVK